MVIKRSRSVIKKNEGGYNTQKSNSIPQPRTIQKSNSIPQPGMIQNSNLEPTNLELVDVKVDQISRRDFSCYTVPKVANHSNTQGRTSGAISLVYAKTGNRLTLSKQIVTELGNPKSIQVIYDEKEIIIGNDLIPDAPSYKISYQNGKGNIYSKPLVEELKTNYDLDFSHRTSRSVGNVTFERSHINGYKYAVITDIQN